ncbi:hypothetical protein E3P99_01249 [Wallemia hederae]|uniref:CHCH domain-containing protein n=1 Tax=Wallemia hederae TaxID=1540922 RepID=A0A4T0FRF2_9BASI|nr:hypothetical protein E3P99_01249 [Wallemia hederae]
MGFGNPSTSNNIFSINPPARGSFPLDHDGDCTQPMKVYLDCLKKNKNNNGACRELSKSYLKCRMNNGLMDNDNFDNLGFTGVKDADAKSGDNKAERLV